MRCCLWELNHHIFWLVSVSMGFFENVLFSDCFFFSPIVSGPCKNCSTWKEHFKARHFSIQCTADKKKDVLIGTIEWGWGKICFPPLQSAVIEIRKFMYEWINLEAFSKQQFCIYTYLLSVPELQETIDTSLMSVYKKKLPILQWEHRNKRYIGRGQTNILLKNIQLFVHNHFKCIFLNYFTHSCKNTFKVCFPNKGQTCRLI